MGEKYGHRHALRAFLVGVVLASVASDVGAQVQRNHIPVIVNYYNNSGLSENDPKVDQVISKANQILKDAGADMILWVVKEKDPATDGDAGNDGKISAGNNAAEMKDINKAGKDEVESYKDKNKTGLKLSFVDDSWVERPSVGGWCYTGNPVIVLEEFPSVDDMGRYLVHELSHALGNKEHSTGPNDVTNASGSGETIPAAWLAKMKSNRRELAKCSTQFDNANPGVRDPAQRGQSTDSRGDQGSGGFGPSPGYLDLGTTRLRSLDGQSNINGYLAVDDVFSGTVDALFVLSFDTDNSLTSGFTSGPFFGREVDLELHVTGSAGNYFVTGLVRDLATNAIANLPIAPTIDTDEVHAELPGSVEFASSRLDFKVPKAMLGLDVNYVAGVSPDDVPVGVYVASNSFIVDQNEFDYTMNMWLLEPTLQTFGTGVPTPGLAYPFAISGMNPFDSYELYLDETAVFSGVLDAAGNDSGQFIFPVTESSAVPHFLTAQDSTTNIAYNSTCPRPSAGIPAMPNTGAIALALLLLACGVIFMRHRTQALAD